MFKYPTIFSILFLTTVIGCAQQNNQDYQGEWIGFLPDLNCFNFQVALTNSGGNNYQLAIGNEKVLIEKQVTSSSKDALVFDLTEHLSFDLKYTNGKQKLVGFLKTGRYYNHISLERVGNDKYVGGWHPLQQNNGLQSDDIDLYMENDGEGNLMAYPFFGDQRVRGVWPLDFKRQGNTLTFRDSFSGLNFRAILLEHTVALEILLMDQLLTKTSLTHTDDGWDYDMEPVDQLQDTSTPKGLDDGWPTANISTFNIDGDELLRLITDIKAQKLVNTHSVLIAKEGKLVFENYFDGFNANIPHDLRSASKSISSAIIGIAIDDGIIEGVDERLYDFVPEQYQYTKDSLKSDITIKDLLTMSSGLDVNDKASEGFYQNPNTSKNWLKTVLEAPMVKTPGTYADYGSANPFLLGVCLNERLQQPLEAYMDEKLFAPLGVTNYINQTDDTEVIPYFGGGMLLTPRDLLKFGQLYLNKGQWNGQQLIAERWVAESFTKHMRLQDVRDKNEYGYLWWHDTYTVGERAIASIEARGAGGQFIFILPELEAVVVITSGNFRNRKGNQPREILKEYLLPAILK
ncbi:serine hydrolase [uncultured Croceitalea sp.]|uniref:serine hydrolase domain-containing protein n=1 Tax=uncultured Croceitalea sp. TaxID=1798908 RepID=UPI003305B81A